MKLFTFALVVLLIGISEANKKEKWRKMEKHLKMKKAHPLTELTKANNSDDKGKEGVPVVPNHENEHRFVKKGKSYASKKKFYKKKKLHKALSWLNLRSAMDCGLQCKHNEVCISGPVMNKAMCVPKKDLKKSMKMFHKYHKKDMKALKKIQKQKFKSDWKNEEKSEKEEIFGKEKLFGNDEKKEEMKKTEEKHEDNEEIYGKKEEFDKKDDRWGDEKHYGNEHKHGEKEKYGEKKEKHQKKIGKHEKSKYNLKKDSKAFEEYMKMKKQLKEGKLSMKEQYLLKKYMKKHRGGKKFHDKKEKKDKRWKKNKKWNKKHHLYNNNAQRGGCGMGEQGQIKNRMLAWFHLLHGQDHQARKAHGGNIKHFHKHFSVKKELREHNGEKCMCMKSAIWQFHKMDVDGDDRLTKSELTMLEENSMEPCIGPYLQSCDRDGDENIDSNEWCCCFTNFLPPCFKRQNDIRRSGKPVYYMPRCDKEGYFMHEQCKGESDTEGKQKCWCVDQNGNEYKDTLKEGRAHCSKMSKFAYPKKEMPML